MGTVAEPLREGGEEGQHEGKKRERKASYGKQCGGIDVTRILFGLVGKAEEGGLHTEGEQNEDECGVGVHVGHHTVFARNCRHHEGIDRDEQVVEEAAYDGGEAVEGGIFEEGFEEGHGREVGERAAIYGCCGDAFKRGCLGGCRRRGSCRGAYRPAGWLRGHGGCA